MRDGHHITNRDRGRSSPRAGIVLAILSIAAAGCWVRSVYASDTYLFAWAGEVWMVRSSGGAITIGNRPTVEVLAEMDRLRMLEARQLNRRLSLDVGLSELSAINHRHTMRGPLEPQVAMELQEAQRQRAAINARLRAIATPLGANSSLTEHRIPYWSVLSATIVAFFVSRLRAIRAHWRAVRGLCACCGYDIRSTPGRCPECGWGQPESGTRGAGDAHDPADAGVAAPHTS
jgi:hypothetical protein